MNVFWDDSDLLAYIRLNHVIQIYDKSNAVKVNGGEKKSSLGAISRKSKTEQTEQLGH
jgi:hypothetical protein